MVLIIKRNSKNRKLKELTNMPKTKRGFKASEYCGKVKVKEDAVTIQKKLRNEWK